MTFSTLKRIFCISGMGADERIFSKLEIPGFELVPVRWVPFADGDDMQSYAMKLTRQISDEHPILLGLSLGGMLAVEMGKIIKAEKIILVSSAKVSSSLPAVSRLPFANGLISVLPEVLFKRQGYIGLNLFGAENKEERNLLSAMLKDTPKGFIRWAMKVVVSWRNKEYPAEVVQIHGTKDLVIRASCVHSDYWVSGGSHVMIYNRATEVSRIITACLH